MAEEKEKKYSGYGYHGGGRPKKAQEEKTIYKTVSICGSPSEIEKLKELAQAAGLTVSRYILDNLLK